MHRKIVYLINPISGTRGKTSLQELIIQKTREQKIDFELAQTNAEGDYGFLLEKIRNQEVTDVVVCGGDGTVNTVFAALQGTGVHMGIIPMGSGNGLALSAKIPRNPSRALDLVFTGEARPIDCFYINDQFSCMLCGIGFDAAVAHEFAKQPSRGLKTYIKTTWSQFFGAKPYPFEIQCNGNNFQANAYFISIANANQFGNQFTIAPQAALNDGLLDIVLVQQMNKLSLVISVIAQVLGFHPLEKNGGSVKHSGIRYFQTPELQIKNPARAPLHIDGDPRETSENFRVSILPGALHLIRPKD